MNMITKKPTKLCITGGSNLGVRTNTTFGKHSSLDLKAVALLVFTALSVIGMGVGYWQFVVNKIPDVCDASRLPNAHYVALLDDTDRLDDEVIGVLRDRIMDITAHLETGSWLSILTINPSMGNGKVIKTYLQLCKPKNAKEVDVWTENGKKIDQAFNNDYVEVLEQALRNLRQYAHTDAAQSSPLVRSIYEISKMSNFSPAIPTRRLLIVSDLINHSQSTCSFFNKGVSCNMEKLSDNFYVKSVAGNLAGVQLELIRLENQYKDFQKKSSFLQFWNDYFTLVGVDLKEIDQAVLIVNPDVGTMKSSRQWAVEVAAYQHHNHAKQMSKQLNDHGFNSFDQRKDNLYVVLVGPEQCQQAAKLTKDFIKRDFNVVGKVVSF